MDIEQTILNLANLAKASGKFETAVIEDVNVTASPECNPDILLDKFMVAWEGDYRFKYVCH